MFKLLIQVFIIFSFILPVSADTLRIGQIDSSRLLLNQEIKAYISVTRKGKPVKDLEEENFTLFESSFDRDEIYKEVSIIDFKKGINYEKGINFLLLVDNSGSMYKDLKGKSTGKDSVRRITISKKVIREFISTITNPEDKIGIAAFNSDYTSLRLPTRDRVKVEKDLEKIIKPVADEGYSEIYASLSMAVNDFKNSRGRKVIIILSDGRNTYYKGVGENPDRTLDSKHYKYTDAIRAALKEGISIFSINFGRGDLKDRHLGKISEQTGGMIFDAANGKELGQMYRKIVNLVVHEYELTYVGTMEPADIKYLKVSVNQTGDDVNLREKKDETATGYYFSSTIFGIPQGLSLLFLIPLLLALFLLWSITKLKFEKKINGAGLDIIGGSPTVLFDKSNNKGTIPLAEGGKTIISMSQGKTIIADENHRSTIGEELRGDRATIMFDDKKSAYVLNSTTPVKINNNAVTTKVLKSGDMLNIEGHTIVFDDKISEPENHKGEE